MKIFTLLLAIISFSGVSSGPPAGDPKSSIVEQLLERENIKKSLRCMALRYTENFAAKIKKREIAEEAASRMFDPGNVIQAVERQLYREYDETKYKALLNWRNTSAAYQKLSQTDKENTCRPLTSVKGLDESRRKKFEDLYFAMRVDYYERQAIKAFSKEHAWYYHDIGNTFLSRHR